jgi:serine/threonine-protein kinase
MRICPTCNRLYRSSSAVCSRDGSLLTTLRDWQPGDSVSEKFRIVEKIGEGSLGPVFRAKAVPFGGLRVLKSLSVHLAEDKDLIERFRREIQVASAVRHLNVAHMESLERAPDGRPFIVMEYVPGLTLRELLSRGGYMPAPDVVDIMGQICAALDCAHWQGIIHRNLKPDNVIIAEEHDGAPRVKVMEVGMANLREAAAECGKPVGDVVVTDRGAVVGTFEYMSPQQAAGTPTSGLDGRADLYSVGVMMFEALTGDLPISAEDPMGLLSQKQRFGGNELLCGTVLKALQKDPDYRFQSAAEMIASLQEVSYSLGRPTPFEVELDPGALAARVSSSSRAAQQLSEDSPDQPPARSTRRNAEDTHLRIPIAGAKPPNRPTLSMAAASTDRTIDEIRKALSPAARGGFGRSEQKNSKVRKSFLVVGFAMVVLLASWLVYRDRGLLWEANGRGTGGQVSLSPPQVPARDAASDLEPQEIHVPPPASPSESQGPPSIEKSPSLPLPMASDDVNASFLPQPARGQSPSQKLQSARAARVGNQNSEPLAERLGSPRGSEASNSREAEVKERIAAGWFFIRRKDYRSAVESLTEALTIDPSNVEAQAALRLARFASQNPDVDVVPSDSPMGQSDEKKGQP